MKEKRKKNREVGKGRRTECEWERRSVDDGKEGGMRQVKKRVRSKNAS